MKIYGVLRNDFFRHKPWFMPERLWRVVCNRANPRPDLYMKDLFLEHFPDGIFSDDALPKNMQAEDRLVLLYPDAIGIGYSLLEIRAFASHQLEVLNGRRRHFRLTYGHWILLMSKRFLEVSFLPELILMPVIVVYACFCSFIDTLRGRS